MSSWLPGKTDPRRKIVKWSSVNKCAIVGIDEHARREWPERFTGIRIKQIRIVIGVNHGPYEGPRNRRDWNQIQEIKRRIGKSPMGIVGTPKIFPAHTHVEREAGIH